ncbi:MAG TPA: hypothetical protein VK923_12770 [Euzebyales bacterium]|nr:hypothetical protein [Euzebyales bacterium]
MVLLATACRLSDTGRDAQRRLAELIAAGRPRAAWAATGRLMAAGRVRGWLWSALPWLTGPSSTPDDPSDLLTVIRAENACDLTDELHLIPVPTLVVVGGRDRPYGPDLARVTARGIPDARLLLYPRKGHIASAAHRPAYRQITRFLRRAGHRRRAADRRAARGQFACHCRPAVDQDVTWLAWRVMQSSSAAVTPTINSAATSRPAR